MQTETPGQSAQQAAPGAQSPAPAPRIASVPHTERRFSGLDLSHDPGEVFPGFLTRADNLRLRYGKLVTRPGWQGRLAAKHGAPIYGLSEYRNADGTTTLLYDTGGRVYALPQGATSATEVTVPGSGALNSSGAQYARLGPYLYRVDGAAPPIRIDPTGGTSNLALSAPAAAPTAALTSTLLDDWSDLSHWSADALSGTAANLMPNTGFAGGTTDPSHSGRYNVMPGYTASGPTPDWGDPAAGGDTSGIYFIFDTPGDTFTTTDALVNVANSLDGSRSATSFYIGGTYFNNDSAATDPATIIATAVAYATTDGTGAEMGRVTQAWAIPVGGNQDAQVGGVFEFGDVPTPIGSYRVSYTAGATNRNASTAPCLKEPVSYPLATPVAFAAGPGQAVTVTQPPLPDVGGVPATLTPAQQGTLLWSGLHLHRAFAADKDLSGADNLDIPLGPGFPVGSLTETGLTLRLRLHASGAVSGVSAAWWTTNPVSVTEGSATVDISTLPLGVLQSVDMMEMVFTSDASLSGGLAVSLGPLLAAGDLSVAPAGLSPYAPLYYAFTEVDDCGDATLADPIESNPSPVSGQVQPTAQQAQGLLALPAPVNGTATHLRVYRFGGVFSDGLGRLVATCDLSSDSTTDSDAGLVTWDHAARTLTDNTPDQWLEVTSAAVLDYGRDAPPDGMTSVCAHLGRIWGAKGGTVYGSWLVIGDKQNALYMNETLDPADPNALIKGDTFTVGGDDSDPVVAMASLGQNAFFTKGYMVIFKRSSVYLLAGTDTSNLSLTPYLVKAGVGCVGGNAWGVLAGRIWFVSDDGIYSFAADFADPKSVVIDRGLLAPAALGGCDPAAWALASVVVHDRRAHVCVPTPGDSYPTVKYVCDSREQAPGGWTRDTGGGAVSCAFTGGASLSGGSAAGTLYWAGRDGQVYAETGETDKPLSSSSGSGVPYAVATRGIGQEAEGLDYWRERSASWYMARLSTAQAGGQVTCGIAGDAAAWTEAQYLSAAGGETQIMKDAPDYVRGAALEVTLSGTATRQHEIQALGAITASGGLR